MILIESFEGVECLLIIIIFFLIFRWNTMEAYTLVSLVVMERLCRIVVTHPPSLKLLLTSKCLGSIVDNGKLTSEQYISKLFLETDKYRVRNGRSLSRPAACHRLKGSKRNFGRVTLGNDHDPNSRKSPLLERLSTKN